MTEVDRGKRIAQGEGRGKDDTKFELAVEKQRFVHCYQGSQRKEYCSLHQNCLGLSRGY